MTIAVVMGVAGSGKTTIAAGISRELGWTLLEGDAFHSAENVAKMKAGIPLRDEDRWPWLRAIAERADALQAGGTSVVVASSALKRAYRAILIGDRRDAILIYLRGSHELIRQRMAARQGHFMPTALLDSQFATLEEPGPAENPIVIDIGQPPEALITNVVRAIQERAV